MQARAIFEAAAPAARVTLAIAVGAGKRRAFLDVGAFLPVRVSRPGPHWPCGRLHHHHLGAVRAGRLGLRVALGAKAGKIHLALRRFKSGRLFFGRARAASGRGAQLAPGVGARSRIGIVERGALPCVARVPRLLCFTLFTALGRVGVGCQALAHTLRGFFARSAFARQGFGAFARLHLVAAIARIAGPVGVGHLAGARVRAAQHLGLRRQGDSEAGAAKRCAHAQRPTMQRAGVHARPQNMSSERGSHWPLLGLYRS